MTAAKLATVHDELADRRDLILAAALTLFLEKGVAGTTTQDLREASGASIGSIYHWFGSKFGIASTLYLEGLADIYARLTAVLSTTATADDGVRQSVETYLRWVEEKPALARYFLHCQEPEVIEASEADARLLHEQFYADLGRWVERHRKEGQLRRLPATLFAALWLGPTIEFSRSWLDGTRSAKLLTEATAVLPGAACNALHTSSAGA